MVQHLVNKDWFNTPCFIRIYFNDKQKIRLLFSLGMSRRDPHLKLFAQMKFESHDCKWKTWSTHSGGSCSQLLDLIRAATDIRHPMTMPLLVPRIYHRLYTTN